MLNYQSEEYITLDQLKETVPSIFTKNGGPTTSEKYTHIPTDKVIKDMELLGWKVADAKEVAARTSDTKTFQKHLVVFRNPDISITSKMKNVKKDDTSPTGYRKSDGTFGPKDPTDVIWPQILLTNSHDGKNSFSFTAGLFRMVCENGLVISTEEFADLKIRHMGYDFSTLQDTIKAIVEQLPLTVESMSKMRDTELSEKNTLKLAKELLDIRVKDTKNQYEDSAINEVLIPQRAEDSGNGLWEVFNRIQENIMEGNFQYKSNDNKLRYARVIKNFKQDIDLNKKMFSTALTYAA